MTIDLKGFGSLICVAVGWMLAMLTRHFEEVWFGAKLKIDCNNVPGTKDENHPTDVYVKFRLRNSFLPASGHLPTIEEHTASRWWLLVMARHPKQRRCASIITAIGTM
jgi:hypothetical protein